MRGISYLAFLAVLLCGQSRASTVYTCVAGDNSAEINAALASTSVTLIGRCHVANQINVPQDECLVGDIGDATIDVDSDFNPSAIGVITLIATSQNNLARPCLKRLRVYEHFPPDVTAKATAAVAGSSTLTISGATGQIAVGMYAADPVNPAALPWGNYGAYPSNYVTVTNIVGSTITLSSPIGAAIASGESVNFASPRAAFAPLGSCSGNTPGSSPCKYPWAIYGYNVRNPYLDEIFVEQAWNGIYLHGTSTAHMGYALASAFNIGLDVDGIHNFPQFDDYEFWNFGAANVNPSPAPNYYALQNVFYDGATVAANIGATDGGAFGHIQSWTGKVNLTSTFSFANFGDIMLDGNNANLSVANCFWAQIGRLYSTKSAGSAGTPLSVAANPACRVLISNIYLPLTQTAISLSSGSLSISGGYLWDGIVGSASSFVSQTGGNLFIANTMLDGGSPSTGHTWLTQTGGSINFVGNPFVFKPAPNGGTALSLVDNAANNVGANGWNAWTFTPPGPLGTY